VTCKCHPGLFNRGREIDEGNGHDDGDGFLSGQDNVLIDGGGGRETDEGNGYEDGDGSLSGQDNVLIDGGGGRETGEGNGQDDSDDFSATTSFSGTQQASFSDFSFYDQDFWYFMKYLPLHKPKPWYNTADELSQVEQGSQGGANQDAAMAILVTHDGTKSPTPDLDLLATVVASSVPALDAVRNYAD
jgi:hypothetical protein